MYLLITILKISSNNNLNHSPKQNTKNRMSIKRKINIKMKVMKNVTLIALFHSTVTKSSLQPLLTLTMMLLLE